VVVVVVVMNSIPAALGSLGLLVGQQPCRLHLANAARHCSSRDGDA
jgi:hypothetical protein